MGRLFISPSAMQTFLSGALTGGDVMIDIDPERGIFEAVKVDGAPARRKTRLLAGKSKPARVAAPGKRKGHRNDARGRQIEAMINNVVNDQVLPRVQVIKALMAQGVSPAGARNVLARMIARGDAILDAAKNVALRQPAQKVA